MEVDRFNIGGYKKGYWIRITREEAYGIISSLAEQMSKNSINVGRKEFATKDNEYFTVGVIPIPEPKKVIPKYETWEKTIKRFKTKKKKRAKK